MRADHALEVEAARAGLERLHAHLQPRAAIVEAGLVDHHSAVVDGVVDLDHRLPLCPGVTVVQDDLAAVERRAAGGLVLLAGEAGEFDDEGQVLQHDAVVHQQDRRALDAAFGYQQVGAKARVQRREPMLGRHLVDHAAAEERLLVLEEHLGADQEAAVEQAADEDQHDRAMRGQVAVAVRFALARGDHHAVGPRLDLGLPAAARQQRRHALERGVAAFGHRAAGLVPEGQQRLLADVFLVRLQLGDDLGRGAHDAQTRRDDEEAQHQHVPPRAVDREQPDRVEHLGPERPELVDVVVEWLVLQDDGADHRGDADDRQQRDREAHRRQQLDELTQQTRGVATAVAHRRRAHQAIMAPAVSGRPPSAR